ncbi:hypothetical protein ACIGO9_30205 [Nocardia asteroides]|uniref:hypothetical protein n=1 Tax=Nocardia asteroides TaxID=1824 RepID=UPI0037C6C209
MLYAAVADSTGTVSARVISWTHLPGQIEFDDRHETQSPDWHEGVSVSVLAALSATEDEHAQQWRADAEHWNRHGTSTEARLATAIGQVIALPSDYDDYVGLPEFEGVVKVLDAHTFQVAAPQIDGTVALGQTLSAPDRWQMDDFSVLSPAQIIEWARAQDPAAAVASGIDPLRTALSEREIDLVLHWAADLWQLLGDTTGDLSEGQRNALDKIMAVREQLITAGSEPAAAITAAVTSASVRPGTGPGIDGNAPAPAPEVTGEVDGVAELG